MFLAAAANAARSGVVRRKVSGITVPHHLVAADLIALAFSAVDASAVDQVIVLFPDHFKRTRRPFATTTRDFETAFGRLNVNGRHARMLLQARTLVEDSDLFAGDHGIGAVLPFIKHYLPAVRVVPIAVAIGSRKAEWDELVGLIRRIVNAKTLVVQSTDFSHYLPLAEAVQRDQEVLNILAAGRLDAVSRLRQPQHADSRGSQYLQMRLQREIFHARMAVLFNANSQAYSIQSVPQTTSYIVQLYEPQRTPRIGGDTAGSQVYCFAGDTFFGRGVLRALADRDEAERVQREMRQVLNGCRLIVNLTGVVVADLPTNLEPMTLAMPLSPTLQWLKALNVTAVNLANNHSMDLGREAFDTMARHLADAGITVLRHGAVADLGPFRLVALTDVDNATRRNGGVIEDADIMRLLNSAAKPPLFAVMSWGAENEAQPGARELALTERLREAAVPLIVGVRPHVAAGELHLIGGGQALMAYSLGNFLFDQSSRRASGAILEVRLFKQGTFFARLVPIPNFYDRLRRH